MDPFQKYMQLNSQVVRNRDEFWTFFDLPNFKKVEVTPTSAKVIEAHMLNFNAIFAPFLVKMLGRSPSSVECALASHIHFWSTAPSWG